jgi:hypothetical protein
MNEETDRIMINLKVTAVQMAPEVWMQGDLEIVINGHKPCSESDIVDVDALMKSLDEEGEHFIFSCSCGIPECSGWMKGIQVSHQGDMITWVDPNTNRTWKIDRGRMEEDLEAAWEEVKLFQNYFNERQINYVGFGYKP